MIDERLASVGLAWGEIVAWGEGRVEGGVEESGVGGLTFFGPISMFFRPIFDDFGTYF